MAHHRWELVPHGNIPHEVLSILLGSLPRVPDPRQEVEALQRQSTIHDDRLSEDDEDEDSSRRTVSPRIAQESSTFAQGERVTKDESGDDGEGRPWNVPDDEWEWSDGEQQQQQTLTSTTGRVSRPVGQPARHGSTLTVPSASRTTKESLKGLGLDAATAGLQLNSTTSDPVGTSREEDISSPSRPRLNSGSGNSSNTSTAVTTPSSDGHHHHHHHPLSVAQDLCISVCDSGRYLACASKKMFAILQRQPRSTGTSPRGESISTHTHRTGSPQVVEDWVLIGQGSSLDGPLDGITTILCLPLYAPRSSQSQVYVVVGYKSGMIRIFNESGQLVVVQQLHHTPVVSIKTRIGTGKIPGEDEDEMTILHEGGKVVCIEGESLWVVLRLSGGSGRHGGPARHKPTLSNGFSSSSSSSMYTSQATERFISVGSKPMVAFYASSSSGRPLFSATSLATQMAARVTSAVFGFAKSIWGGGGSGISSRPGSPALGNSSGRSSPDSKRLSGQGLQDGNGGTAGPHGTIYPSALAPATEVPAVLWLSDSQRCIRHVSLAPAPPRGSCYHNPSKLAAMTDSLGRVLLVDLEECEIIRMWKGLRGAKCGWIQEERVVRSKVPTVASSGKNDQEDQQQPTVVRKHLLLYLVIYAPKRGTVEVYPARQGKRVGLLQAGLGWKVCTTFASPIGRPVVLDRSLIVPGTSFSAVIDPSKNEASHVEGSRQDLAQCLLIGPTGEVMTVRSRLVDSPDPTSVKSTMTSPQSNNSLTVSPSIPTDSIASQLQGPGTSQ
ncbi:Rab3 GTPase-activating protein non-catalytic subunit [Gryganskiella cystojenkinii]|nr:Rab3 GTPase-activating protein non-catalytic subunit [Gryganskiella cystojenkinii]